MVWAVIGALLIVWLVMTILGAIVKGLFWLAVLAGLLFVGTAVYGWARQRINK